MGKHCVGGEIDDPLGPYTSNFLSNSKAKPKYLCLRRMKLSFSSCFICRVQVLCSFIGVFFITHSIFPNSWDSLEGESFIFFPNVLVLPFMFSAGVDFSLM